MMGTDGKGAKLSRADREDIQALVTSGFAHLSHCVYLFVEIIEPAAGRRMLRWLLPQITSAAPWREGTQPKNKPRLALNVALTGDGLRALGLSEEALATFPAELREGMASTATSRRLGQSGPDDPARWTIGGPGNPAMHLMLVVHAEQYEQLDAETARIREHVRGLQGCVREHAGLQQTGYRPSPNREHFGFRDGLSQPDIAGIHAEGVAAGEFILGHPNEYLVHAPTPIVPLVEDHSRILPPPVRPPREVITHGDLGRNGSYLVYRKLRQDVAGFWSFLAQETLRYREAIDPEFMVWLAAKMVGRWPNGIALAAGSRQQTEEDNAFGYGQDHAGMGCPYGAHVRRANPRDDLRPAPPAQSRRMTSRHRILRRGSMFGPRLFDLDKLDRHNDADALSFLPNLQDDGERRGLHFLAVNASFRSQFEFIQQAWLNNPHFAGLSNNPDPFAGSATRTEAPMAMSVPAETMPLRTSELPAWVQLEGGGYFFLPSLSALRFLSANLPGGTQ